MYNDNKTDKYKDRTDIDLKTSLYEYSIIRDPKTDKCIICSNTHQLNPDCGRLNPSSTKPIIKVVYISFEDVKEALEEVHEGYFDFIGSTRREELKRLTNDYLTHSITSLNSWDGSFSLKE